MFVKRRMHASLPLEEEGTGDNTETSRFEPLRISVITPCHNAGRWIAVALRSIAAQTHSAHEIIVIDDASTDDSVDQIERSGVAVTLLRVNGRNAAAARNAGIQAATGDWLALLDADDVWYPNHLARAVELLSQTDDVAFMSNHDWISLDGAPVRMPDACVCKLPAPRSGLTVEDYYRIGRNGFHFGHSTVLYRRDRVVDVGLYDVTQKRRHDIDLWLRVIEGRTWTYDTVKGAGYRDAVPGSLSRDELECDYYYLRALAKNAARIGTPLFCKYLARQARRAMGIAFVDGSKEQYARIRALAWPHLSTAYRFFYAWAEVTPGLARAMMKTKRRMVMPSDRGARGANP
jgi:glycosyltransferase involved in cell wall biosynthesis